MNFHMVNTVYVILTVIIGNKPLRKVHVLYLMLFVTLYIFVTLIYQATTGHAIYDSFDWTKFPKTLIVSMVIVFIVTPLSYSAMFGLAFLRDSSLSVSKTLYDVVHKINVCKVCKCRENNNAT